MSLILRQINRWLDWLTAPIEHPASRRLVQISLYTAGLALWIWFFRSPANPVFYTACDWPKEYKYFAVLQAAVAGPTIPWHTDIKLQPSQPTDRFMAIPETLSPWAPQVQLLRWMPIKTFVIFNTLLLYSIGMAGFFKLCRTCRLAPLPAAFGFLIFMLNGHIVAHFSAGHTMWSGYFLLPWLLYFIFDGWFNAFTLRHALLAALAMGGMALQGSIHIFIWCLLFLGLLFLTTPSRMRHLILTLTVAVLLALHRLLPAAITFQPAHQLVRGFPDLAGFAHAFVSRHLYTGSIFPWEFNYYISPPGAAIIILGGILSFHYHRKRADWKLWIPIVLFTVFSFRNYIFAAAAALPIPLLTTQRVPGRFLILPLLFLTTIACVNIQTWLNMRPAADTGKRLAGWLLAATVAAGGWMMLRHFAWWRMAGTEQHFLRQTPVDWSLMPAMVVRPDVFYKDSVMIATGISLATLLVVFVLLRRQRNRRTAETTV